MKELNYINVIDVVTSCWENNIVPPGQDNEIIEIRIAEVNLKELAIMKSQNILIKPKNSEISEFCEKETGITEQQIINNGRTFSEAMTYLQNAFDIKSRVWISWGDYSRVQIVKNCKINKIGYPFGKTFMNLKNVYSIMNGLPYELGLNKVIGFLTRNPEDSYNDKDNAYNIAKIFISIRKRFKNAKGNRINTRDTEIIKEDVNND